MKILCVEDEFAHAALTRRALEESFQHGFELIHAETVSSALTILNATPDVDLVLSDLRLPDGTGLDLLSLVKARSTPLPVVLVTGQGDQEKAVAAIKGGAADYLVKQSDYLLRLPVAITNAIAQNRLVREQAALREAEIKYQSLVEKIQAVVFLDAADEEETGIYISPSVETLTGYAPDEWLRNVSLWDDLLFKDDRERVLAAYKKSHNGLTPFIEEYRITRKDGEVVWVKETTNLIRDETGAPLYWQGILLDINQEKKASAAIQESEDRFRRIFHSSPIATCVVEFDSGKFIDANNAFQKLVGVSLNELIGRTSIDMGFWKSSLDRNLFIEELEIKGAIEGVEIRYKNVPGGPKVTIASYQLIELSGHPSVLAMFYDVTEAKKAQAALQGERDFALQILNTMVQGLTITTDNSTFEYVNPAYASMIGYSQDELIGRRPSDFTAPSALDVLNDEGENRRRGITSTYESTLVHKDGRTVPVIISGVPRLQNGKPTGAIAVITDLTAIKRAEASLARQVKELTILHLAATAEAEVATSEDGLIEKITGIISQIYTEVCGILLLNQAGDILIPHSSYRGADVANWMSGYPISQGVTGKSVLLGKPIRLGRVETESSYIEIASGIRSELCVPILVNERIIGVINMESKAPDAYDDGDERFLVTIAGGLGGALERIRLYKAEQHRIRELEIINQISTYLRTAQTLDEMLVILLDEIMNLINTAHGSIWLYDQSNDLLVQRIAKGAETKLDKTALRPTDGIIGHTFTSGKKYISRELKTDPLLYEGNRNSVATGLGCVAIPIQSTAGAVGVLMTLIESNRQITNDEINLLTIFAEITGNAVHRTELLEQGQEQIRRLTTLRDVDSAIASSTDLRVTLNILTDYTLKHLKVDAVDILIYRPEIQNLTYFTSAGFNALSPSRPLVRIGEGLAGQVVMKGKTDHVTDLKNSPEAKRDPLLLREGFVTYIGVPLLVKGQVKGVFEVFHRSPLSPNADWMQFLQTLAGQAAIAIDNAQLFDNLQKTNQELTQAYDTTLEGWARALELRDRETEGHTRRVTDLTMRLAHAMGIKDEDLVNIYRGVLLHDIGKMGVPDHILKKTGPLTEPEWDEMRRHPKYAYDLLSPINYLRPALDIPYCHHEHWDGSGYPNKLKGEQIPLAARIFSVVDSWDALLSDRPYRKAWPRHKVIEYIRASGGSILDSAIVDIFLTMMTDED